MSLVNGPISVENGKNWHWHGVVVVIERLLETVSRCRKPLALVACDAVLIIMSGYLTLCIDASVFPLSVGAASGLMQFLIPRLIIRIGMLAAFGAYRTVVRHTGARDVMRLASAATVSSLVFAAFAMLNRPSVYGISTIIIGWYTHLFLIAGSRVGYRLYWSLREERRGARSGGHAQRMVILGAGLRGASLARELRTRGAGRIQVVGFLDDDPYKRGLRIDGVPVRGALAELPAIVAEKEIDLVVIAMGAANGKLLRDVLQMCEGTNVRFQVAPSMDLFRRDRPIETLRDVALEDLLHRKSVTIDMSAVGSYLGGQRVLITGAGGSIGSELVRQIAVQKPSELILLGHGENSLFEIQQELLRKVGAAVSCVVADVRDYDRLLQIFMRHRPSVVFHAAAHKHVGLMESNPEEAVTNNVLGTRNLARIASRTGVTRFVMISTDKAVNPTSVMGMSKRVAEKIIQAESRRSQTQFACVRFGNVLGSRGSVVPLMRKQIESGGPVTVTHPDIVRYFMTIPEAAQLVITAGAMGENGAIYLLEMGEPVRILDLAEDLIRLAGLTPGKDIPIEITGLKKGEKLYEELLTAEEGARVTHHERIYAAPPTPFCPDTLNQYVDGLIAAARSGDTHEVIRRLQLVEDLAQAQEETCLVRMPGSIGLAA